MSVIDIRRRIIDGNLVECPVCFSSLNEEILVRIKDAINNVAMDNDIKEELLMLLSKETNQNVLIDFFEHKDNIDEWTRIFKNNLDSSIISYAYEEVGDDKAISSFKNTCKELKTLKLELTKNEIPINENEQGEYEKRINNLLKEHKVFVRNGISIRIKSGRLETSGISYEDLSQSEKNFLKFLYFDILLLSKYNDNKTTCLIIDDPFDSYDEATISTLLYILTNSFNNYSPSIESAYVFSHSIRVIYLFAELHSVNLAFELEWIDKLPKDNNLHIFKDNHFLDGIDYSPSDYWVANYIINNSTDGYSLICAAIILREFAFEHSVISVPSTYVNDCNAFYNVVSDNVVHLRSTTFTIEDLYNSFVALYKCKNAITDKSNRIIDLMNNIDEKSLNDITVSVDSGESQDDTIYKLFVVKYLISLRTRQILQDYMLVKHPDLNKHTIGKNVKIIEDNSYTDMNDIVLFYYKNKLLLNEFAHSFTKSFSPYFTCCYEDLVKLYLEVKTLTS